MSIEKNVKKGNETSNFEPSPPYTNSNYGSSTSTLVCAGYREAMEQLYPQRPAKYVSVSSHDRLDSHEMVEVEAKASQFLPR